jgi:hypothetical protein
MGAVKDSPQRTRRNTKAEPRKSVLSGIEYFLFLPYRKFYCDSLKTARL